MRAIGRPTALGRSSNSSWPQLQDEELRQRESDRQQEENRPHLEGDAISLGDRPFAGRVLWDWGELGTMVLGRGHKTNPPTVNHHRYFIGRDRPAVTTKLYENRQVASFPVRKDEMVPFSVTSPRVKDLVVPAPAALAPWLDQSAS
jgi:hypothetical protein